jgi:hypothetical protein
MLQIKFVTFSVVVTLSVVVGVVVFVAPIVERVVYPAYVVDVPLKMTSKLLPLEALFTYGGDVHASEYRKSIKTITVKNILLKKTPFHFFLLNFFQQPNTTRPLF